MKKIIVKMIFTNELLEFKDDSLEDKYFEELNKMPKAKEKEVLNSFDRFMIKKNKQKTIEIAINLLKKGSDNKFTSEVTGLTLKEVEELKKNLK